jgi:hypothetical protein
VLVQESPGLSWNTRACLLFLWKEGWMLRLTVTGKQVVFLGL